MWPIEQDFLVFYAIYSVLFGVIVTALSVATKSKEDDKDPVLLCLLSGSVLFAVMQLMMPDALHAPGPVGQEGGSAEGDSFFGNFFVSLLQTFMLVFTTGPIKVWLDIKRGKTSINDLQADYQDNRGWLHKRLGVDQRGELLPERARGRP